MMKKPTICFRCGFCNEPALSPEAPKPLASMYECYCPSNDKVNFVTGESTHLKCIDINDGNCGGFFLKSELS